MSGIVGGIIALGVAVWAIAWARRLKQADPALYHRSQKFGYLVSLPLITVGTLLGIASFIALIRPNPHDDRLVFLGILALFAWQGAAVWVALKLHRRHFTSEDRHHITKASQSRVIE